MSGRRGARAGVGRTAARRPRCVRGGPGGRRLDCPTVGAWPAGWRDQRVPAGGVLNTGATASEGRVARPLARRADRRGSRRTAGGSSPARTAGPGLPDSGPPGPVPATGTRDPPGSGAPATPRDRSGRPSRRDRGAAPTPRRPARARATSGSTTGRSPRGWPTWEVGAVRQGRGAGGTRDLEMCTPLAGPPASRIGNRIPEWRLRPRPVADSARLGPRTRRGPPTPRMVWPLARGGAPPTR
jgi:hypothetical protein